jgi:hypothetical protein
MSNILTIQFPMDFEKRYNKYKAKLLKVKKTTKKEIVDVAEVQQQSDRPFCIIDGKWGFLKFNKWKPKIKIGGANRQPFKLLRCLTEPFGIAKSVDVVFEAIRENVRYKSKSGIYTNAIDRAQKTKLIEYAIKELQKGNKLKGKLKFNWDDLKTKLWLEYLG